MLTISVSISKKLYIMNMERGGREDRGRQGEGEGQTDRQISIRHPSTGDFDI